MASFQETSHNNNRIKVCLVCYRKGERSLSENDIEVVKAHLIEEYDVKIHFFLREFASDVTSC